MSPMKSQAERGYLWANDPKVAQKFENETPKGAKLPMHVAAPVKPMHEMVTEEVRKRLRLGAPGPKQAIPDSAPTLPSGRPMGD